MSGKSFPASAAAASASASAPCRSRIPASSPIPPSSRPSIQYRASPSRFSTSTSSRRADGFNTTASRNARARMPSAHGTCFSVPASGRSAFPTRSAIAAAFSASERFPSASSRFRVSA